MIALQYRITLPADYDMRIIRKRVQTRGHALDGYRGLGLKAYLIRERGVDGSPVNEYAPFYLWHDDRRATDFLWGGDGFAGVVRDFGRPLVPVWLGNGFVRGGAFAAVPEYALIRKTAIAPGVDPQHPAADRRRWLADVSEQPTLHSAASAIDPHTWQGIEFSLWSGRPVESDMDENREVYQVLHLSHPHVAEL